MCHTRFTLRSPDVHDVWRHVWRSRYSATSHEPFLKNAGYRPTWEQMSNQELAGFFADQAMYHVHSSLPKSGRSRVCSTGGTRPLLCHGSCFVHELPADQLANMKLLINRTRQIDQTKSVIQYSHSMISAEINAS
eukprot:COSAG01_NODE_20398_length_956_cov_0.904317_2_plen_134_part_01